MKTLPLPRFGARPSHPLVEECCNLRPDPLTGDLAPVPQLAAMPCGSCVPAAVYTPRDGSPEVCVYRNGRRLCILNRGMETDAVVIPADTFTVDLDGSVLSVHAAGHRYRYDLAGGNFRNISAEVVPPRVLARRARQVSATVSRHNMRYYYSGGESLVDYDVRALSGLAADAYRRLDAAARIPGERFMPVLMAVRVLDSDGNEVACSMPRLVTDPDNAPFDGIVDFSSSDGKTTDSFDITMPTWKAVADMSCFSAPPGIYTCEVLATPPLHRIDPAAGFSVSLRSRADQQYFARAVPAASPVGVWPGAGRADFLSSLIARFESLASVELSFLVTVPDGATAPADASDVVIPAPHRGDPADDIRRIREALDRPLDPVPAAEAAVAVPHSFSADVICRGPAATLMAGLTASPFSGFRAEDFADIFDSSDTPWHAMARVVMADGSSSVRVSEGTGRAPLAFNPVVGYPGPGAVSLELSVSSGAVVRSASFALRPDGSGRRSIAVSGDFAPASLPEVSGPFVVPPESPSAVPLPDVLAVVSPAGATVCVAPASVGRVNAIVPGRHAQGSWDFGRSRFLLFSTSGIYSVAVGSDRRSVSLSRIDLRVVESPSAVCDTGRGVYAIASGSLLNISGTRVETVAPEVEARALAWDPCREELWLVPPDGDIAVVMPDGQRYTVSSPGDVAETVHLGGVSYILAGGACFSPSVTSPPLSVSVRWSSRMTVPYNSKRWFIARATASLFRGFAEVRDVCVGREAPAPLVSRSFDGSLKSALRYPFCARSREVRVTVAGDVSPDFRLSSIEFPPR